MKLPDGWSIETRPASNVEGAAVNITYDDEHLGGVWDFSPADARAFARELLAAADEVEAIPTTFEGLHLSPNIFMRDSSEERTKPGRCALSEGSCKAADCAEHGWLTEPTQPTDVGGCDVSAGSCRAMDCPQHGLWP